MVIPDYILTNSTQVHNSTQFPFLLIITYSCYFLCICVFAYKSPSNGYEVISHYSFHLHFLIISDDNVFIDSAIHTSSLEKCLFRSFSPLLNWGFIVAEF
jgi:hypothetical protein